MYKAGFKTIRLGLETADVRRQKLTGKKVTNSGFVRAVDNLKAAGFRGDQIGAYLLMGLPNQPFEEVIENINFVHECGILAKISLFSPIPNTPEYDRAVEQTNFPPDADPLLHNNSISPLYPELFEHFEELKRFANKGGRRQYENFNVGTAP